MTTVTDMEDAMTGRQWRLMINGVESDAPDGARAMHDAEDRARAARLEKRVRHVRLGGRVAWRTVVSWALIVAGVLFEVALSVYGLRFGFGWHVVILACLACLLLLIGPRLMR